MNKNFEQCNMPLSSTNRFQFNSPEYLFTLFKNTIGNNIIFPSPFGPKSIVYTDFTASGRGLLEIENFISNQILPFYANVHSSCGYLAEQSEAFRNEVKSIVRRFCETDENNSIIFTGQGTTGAIHKLIKLLNLKEYNLFYNDLKRLNNIYINLKQIFKTEEELKNNFENINKEYINEIREKFKFLFKTNTFFYSNRWGGFDCILCRMSFTTETQYNEHEKNEIHINNLKNLKNNIKNIKNNFIDLISKQYDLNSKTFIYDILNNYNYFQPIIFLSIYEHNSNILSWRETGSNIIYVSDINEFQKELENYKHYYIKMGSFTAASNITGKFLDTNLITILLHKYNALSFFDYAAAAPYIKINMNKPLDEEYRKLLGFNYEIKNEDISLCFYDAVFFSPHKFLGGPNSPGILLIQQRVVRNLLTPSEPGGGVVLFVTKDSANYVKNIEQREESGTPDIIGSVRIGLSLILREKIENEYILNIENNINKKIYDRLLKIKNLHILSDFDINSKHIPIYSFLISFNGKFFHHNYISSLLNDIFGIQSRPGCSCASLYGQTLLGISKEELEILEKLTINGNEIFRPGYTRINFPYFYPEYVIDYIIDSIEFICNNAYKFMGLYAFKIESGKFYNRNQDEKKKWLNDLNFINNKIIIPDFIDEKNKKFIDEKQLNLMKQQAIDLCDDQNIAFLIKRIGLNSNSNLSYLFENNEKNRWFLIWDDVQNLIPIQKDEIKNHFNEFKEKINLSFNKKIVVDWKLKEILKDSYFNNNNINNLNSSEKIILNKEEESKNAQENIEIKNSNLDEINSIINVSSSISESTSDKTKKLDKTLFPPIPPKIGALVRQACKDFNMLQPNDRILVCVSGGKDSLTLLHVMLSIQRVLPFKIQIGAMTVNPMSEDFNPTPLISYMKSLNVDYYFVSESILDNAKKSMENNSICSYCARMKRGIIYSTAKKNNYNVIALGQHLDDLAESFIMSVFHNGRLRTMKANYLIDKGDLRVIRPLIYCREKMFKEFSLNCNLPVIQENCPACFQSPKERQRTKVLLAQQENLFPGLFGSLERAMEPLMKGNIKIEERIKKTRNNKKQQKKEKNKKEEQENNQENDDNNNDNNNDFDDEEELF